MLSARPAVSNASRGGERIAAAAEQRQPLSLTRHSKDKRAAPTTTPTTPLADTAAADAANTRTTNAQGDSNEGVQLLLLHEPRPFTDSPSAEQLPPK